MQPVPRHDTAPAPAPQPGGRRPILALLGAYVVFVVYATALPFQFRWDAATLAEKWRWINWDPTHLVTGEPTPISDLVSNVVFFMPLGFLAGLLQRRRALAALLGCTIAGALLSLMVETLQFFTPMRNPATSDVITNTLGAFAGAWLALVARSHRDGVVALVRRWARREPLLMLLVGLTLLLVLRGLVPLDVSVTVSDLKKAVRGARLDPWADPAPWFGETEVVLAYALLSGLAYTVAGRLGLGRRRILRYLTVVVTLATVAVGLELLQLLVRSRVTATRDVLAAVAGALVGPLVAGVLPRHAPRRLGGVWGVLMSVYVIALAVHALQPFDFHFDLGHLRSKLDRTSLLPYYTHYFKATVEAVTEFLDDLLLYIPLGFVVAHARGDRLPRIALGRAGGTGAAACAALAAVLETLQVGLPGRYPDVSDVVTAGLGGLLGGFVWAWYEQLRRTARPAPTGDTGAASAPQRTSSIFMDSEAASDPSLTT